MIKGKATIQLFDEKSGEVVKELHEENMITNAVDTILNPPDYIEIGMDSDNDRSFNLLRDFAGNIADTAFRGVIVCRDKIPEDGNNMMLPWTNEEIGHAGIANTNTDTSIGTYNANESDRIENGKGYRHVWDFASDKANGEISCICLTTKDGGTNGMHHSYWNLSCGGTDLNSSSLDSFRQAYHTIVGRYIPDSQFNCGVFKWFYMGRLTNGNVRLLGKHIHDGCIYEVVMFDPMSISVSAEKPFCGIISVKKVIELFPAAERIPDSMYDNSYHHGSYFYDCNTTNADYVPQEEKEKLRQDWEDDPQWLAYFPYVIGDKIHIVATSRCHIHHYIFRLSDYSQVSKKTIETDTLLQMYGVGFKYERISNSSSQYNQMMGNRKQIIEDCELMRKKLTDFKSLDADIERHLEETQIVAELVKAAVKDNAVTAQSQEAYLKKYESLTKRYETAAAELARLQNLRTLRSQKDKAVALYIRTLKKQPTVLSEWNDTLWTVMVEKAIVHRNSEITFVFYNGTKVKVRQ